MSNGDDADFGGESLDGLLHKLLEAQVKQTRLLNNLVEVTESLAASERRESWGEFLEGLSKYTKALDTAMASPTQAPPRPTAQVAPPAQQPVLSKEELAVLGGYDELRAALGRTDAKAFYVTATADPIAYTLTIVGEAVKKADTVTVGDKSFPTSSPMSDTTVIDDPPDEVFRTPQPKVRLLAGGRVIAVARLITVQTPSPTPRLRG